MLFMYSNTGPVMTRGDINNDGLEDIFISGHKEVAGTIWKQKIAGGFEMLRGYSFVKEDQAAVADALFCDVNGDGWQDLYLAKGGYSIWEPNTGPLQDELWMNDGKGGFMPASNALPNLSASSKSCVRAADFDKDGDMDLFVGGRVIPGRYPVSPESYLLVNDGKGKFTTATVPFKNIGMVTDAIWHDWDNDGRLDLLLAGEMMPLTFYRNTANGFEQDYEALFETTPEGFWTSLAITDFNADGKADLVAGNIGLNTPFKVSEKQPAELIYADFDKNGSVDPFFNFYVKGELYPYVSRDELNDQIYAMRKKFTSYEQYADATMKDIFTTQELSMSARLYASEQNTTVFLNQNGKLRATHLPVEAQFSMVRKIVTGDFNDDGHEDFLLFGNQVANRLKMGAINANQGSLFLGNGKGGFTYLPQFKSGLRTYGEVKSALPITIAGMPTLLIGATGQPLRAYEKN